MWDKSDDEERSGTLAESEMSQRLLDTREAGSSAPDVGSTAQELVPTAPDVGSNAPARGSGAPDDGSTPRELVLTAPDVGSDAPTRGSSASKLVGTASDVGSTTPDVVPSAPDAGGIVSDALPSPPMRLAPLLLLFLTLVACDSPPAFPAPGGPPLRVALDVQFRVYTMGTWAIDSFDEELATQLRKYNMVVVDRKTEPQLIAEVDLGVLANPHAIDVYLRHNGERAYAGRVRVPDLSTTTLDVAAQLVAPLIARPAWGLSHLEEAE